MSDIKVTQTEIDLLLNSADVQVRTEFGKCTVVTVRLRNGFILTESSACVDPANYDVELGKKLCFQHIENRLWELEGYALQKKTDEERAAKCKAVEAKTHDFGWAQLKENIENVESRMKAIKDVHKDMWSAVKDHNGDAFCALAGEFQRSAILLAMEWTNASVLANIAVLHGEDE